MGGGGEGGEGPRAGATTVLAPRGPGLHHTTFPPLRSLAISHFQREMPRPNATFPQALTKLTFPSLLRTPSIPSSASRERVKERRESIDLSESAFPSLRGAGHSSNIIALSA